MQTKQSKTTPLPTSLNLAHQATIPPALTQADPGYRQLGTPPSAPKPVGNIQISQILINTVGTL